MLDYEYVCKWILCLDDYYLVFMCDNVLLEMVGVEVFVEDGIEICDGCILLFDVVVFGIGFES